MRNLGDKLRGPFGFALLISVMLHLGITALLLVNWDFDRSEPTPEETVSVDIVPPPEEEQKEEENQPEQEPEEQQPEEDEPPPKPEAKPSASSPSPEEVAAALPPIQPFRPVFEFGEKSSGPEKSLEGNSARAKPQEENPPGLAEEESQTLATETPPPQTDAPTADDPNAYPVPLAPEETAKASEETPRPEKTAEDDDLKEVRTLFSPDDGEAAAITAMAGLPRGVRGGQLCTTELREQLRRANPPYHPDLLPAYRFPDGNEMAVRKGAFRASDRWYNLSFKCEINVEGTRITSFAFKVGSEIPRSEWTARGFPEF